MIFFGRFYLDREKDIAVELHMDGERLKYVIRTPNHHTGNLITNLARLCALDISFDEHGLKVIKGEVPCYVDGDNRRLYVLRLGNTKIANIHPDGRIELKASIPAISKTLMSQTKDYRLGVEKTIVKTYIFSDCKFRTDLHTHMNGNLPPDALIALGVIHQIRYPYYYVKKLGLACSPGQIRFLEEKRKQTEAELGDISLTGRHRQRRIDDLTFINFAELILGNPASAAENIDLIRSSLTIPKDGQAVFADLEKVYLYRYVFTKGVPSDERFSGLNIEEIPDREVKAYARRMLLDREDDRYRGNTLYQDLLLWIAREYQKQGVVYAEISDTALADVKQFAGRLRMIHSIMPAVTRETGVTLRFLAGIRRTPLTIVRDRVAPGDYLNENLRCLRCASSDPYVAGCDIIGEEINDIMELRGAIREMVDIARGAPGFVIRIHAGENDSLPDNVAGSIRCVGEALKDGEKPPHLRIGHGLYTCDLRSARGRRLLEDMLAYGVTLEFQITSNVRLNNLSHLDRHPLQQYLRAGISCVQGTDGGALYGTNSIDEELSLEKLLGLSHEELRCMRRSEDAILRDSLDTFEEKNKAFRAALPGGDIERYYLEKLEKTRPVSGDLWQGSGKQSAHEALKELLRSLPEGRFPIVIGGGSFQTGGQKARLRDEDKAFIDRLLALADPDKVSFVVGHTLSGAEGYLAQRAKGRFSLTAIVPSLVSASEKRKLRQTAPGVIVSIESSPMGLYKSFAYEVFKHSPSAVLAFGGNSAVLNLIQEARNARNKCSIFIAARSRTLAAKAKLLKGYVKPMTDVYDFLQQMGLSKTSES